MFTARYGLNPYIKPTLFVFKGYALKPPRYMIIELYIITKGVWVAQSGRVVRVSSPGR